MKTAKNQSYEHENRMGFVKYWRDLSVKSETGF